jgi:hypothetical protein
MEGQILNPAKCVAFFSGLVATGFLIGFIVMLATHQPTISCPTRSPCPTNTDVNLPDFSENDIVIEDATTSITISETFYQPESINSKTEITRTIIPVEPEVVIDAIPLDVNATTMEMLKALQDERIKGNCTFCEENITSDFVRSNSTSLSTYVIPFITEEKVPKAVEIISTASSNTIKKPLIKGSFNGEQVDNVIVDAIELQIDQDQQIIKNQTLEKSSLETVLTEKIEVLNLSNQASEEIRPVIKNPTHQIEKDKLLIKYQTLDILELRREIAEEKKKLNH